MKKLILISGFILSVLTVSAQETVSYSYDTVKLEDNNFNVEKFEKELIRQMQITFPWMKLDTALAYSCRSTKSHEEEGFRDNWGIKRGGMVNTSNSEEKEAVRLVSDYREFLNDIYFDDRSLKNTGFVSFCATATAQYGGLVRYGLSVDNGFSYDDYKEYIKD